MNQNIVLIVGKSATGKTASLMNIDNHESVLYLNCESNKALPFQNQFKTATIIDPIAHIDEAFRYAESTPEIQTIVIDSLTFLMDMFESEYIAGSANTMQMWGEYAQYFKKLMQKKVAASRKNVIFIAHTSDVLNEKEMQVETKVKVKGSLMNQGIESYFNTVIAAKKVSLKLLKEYQSDLLTITEDDELMGYKHVFQTRLTKDTVNETIRASIGMWKQEETFIDNNVQFVIDRLAKFYV